VHTLFYFLVLGIFKYVFEVDKLSSYNVELKGEGG
jgi:hypothetical protein